MNPAFYRQSAPKTVYALATLLLFLPGTDALAQNACSPAPSGLVSWWPADGNGLDVVGGNNATDTNAITFVPGMAGQAFDYDGANSLMIVPASPSLNVSNLTIETWIFPTDASTPRPIFEYGDSTGPSALNFWYNIGTGAQPVPGALFGFARDGQNPDNNFYLASNAGLVPTNQWSHVAFTFDSATGAAVLYVNGTNVATTSFNGPIHPNTRLAVNLGYRPVGSAELYAGFRHAGKLDETSLYNRVLAPSEIQAIYLAGSAGKCVCAPPPSGLVSWWKGESDATDWVSGNNGTFHGGVSIVSGKAGHGFGFDGTGYILVSNTPTLNFSNQLTIELWYLSMQPNSIYYTIIDKRVGATVANYGVNNAPNNGLGVFYDDPTVNDGDDFGSAFEVSRYSPAPDTGVFHHLAATYLQLTNSQVQLQTFLDGQLVKTKVIQGNLANTINNSPITIGAAAQGQGEFFRGVIDEVSIYNRVLEPWEIQSIYRADAAGKCVSPMPPVITSQPASRTAIVGDTVSFTLTVGGTPPFSYQWQRNGKVLDKATAATLTLSDVQLSDAGTYSVIVSNAFGAVTSAVANLTVTLPPPCQKPPAGLVAWWQAEGSAQDLTGNNNGTPVNGASFDSGKVGKGFSFNGAGQFVQVPDSPSLRFTNELTIELWYKDTGSAAGSYYGLIAKRAPYPSGANFGIDLYLGTPRILQVYIQDPNYAGYLTSVSPAPTNGVFHHVAATYRQSAQEQVEIKTFVDSQLVQTSIVPGNLARTLNSAPVTIGADDPNETYFVGIIDEASIYGRALSESEILSVYNAGVAGKCGDLIPPTITTQPANQVVIVGDAVNFTVAAGGSVPLNYQWNFGGAPIPGATTSLLALNNVNKMSAGSYSVVVTNAVGAITSSVAVLTVIKAPVSIQVAGATVSTDGKVTVPVNLVANGDENAVSFSLNFNPNLLTYDSVVLAGGSAGASLLLNSSQAAAGQLGVAVGLPAGVTFGADSQQLVIVSFDSPIVTRPTSTPIGFGDVPIKRLVTDASGGPLDATYVSGSVLLPPTEIEGDVYPRPDGDGALTISDWVLVGRYVARLDFPTNAAEFQRADCAPRTTLGDGDLTVSDWVQAGRYAAGLDSMTRIGGPTSSVPAVVGARVGSAITRKTQSNTRQVKGIAPVLAQGQVGTVEIALEAQGDENALAFSLSFDPAKLTFIGASAGDAATAAALNINANQANQGRLGVVLSLKANQSFAAGSKQLVKVSFRAIAPMIGNVPVSFSDQPIPRGISDSNASVLIADYIDTAVVVNPRFSLKITQSATSFTLSWPASATNYVLQEFSNPSLTAGSWTSVQATATIKNNENQVVIPVSGTSRFYRLYHP